MSRYDFKNCPQANASNMDEYRKGGNFVFGAEAAAIGIPIGEAIDAGWGQRYMNTGDASHPDEQDQAIRDGYNWWMRNAKGYGGTSKLNPLQLGEFDLNAGGKIRDKASSKIRDAINQWWSH